MSLISCNLNLNWFKLLKTGRFQDELPAAWLSHSSGQEAQYGQVASAFVNSSMGKRRGSVSKKKSSRKSSIASADEALDDLNIVISAPNS